MRRALGTKILLGVIALSLGLILSVQAASAYWVIGADWAHDEVRRGVSRDCHRADGPLFCRGSKVYSCHWAPRRYRCRGEEHYRLADGSPSRSCFLQVQLIAKPNKTYDLLYHHINCYTVEGQLIPPGK